MSLFFRRQVEARALSYQDVFGTGGSVDLLGTGVEGALRLIPLFACHRLIIDTVAMMPFHAYREDAAGTPRRMSPQPKLLTDPLIGSTFRWRAQAVASMVSDGNAFGLITSLDRGWPSSVVWLDPAKVAVDDTAVLPEYFVEGRHVDRASIVHVPWIVPPGKHRGLSPLKAFKVAFEMGAGAQAFGRDWMVNGAVPSGHFKSNGYLDSEDAEKAKTKFRAAVEGRDVLVTGDDWSYTPIGVPADEARFIETLRLSATQLATIYGIPPEEVGGDTAGSSLEYKTLEANEMRISRRAGAPWAVRLEDALTGISPPGEYVRANLDAGVRADLKTRMEAHEIALRIGLETQDEGRALEERPPLTDAERQQWLATFGPQARQAPTTRGEE